MEFATAAILFIYLIVASLCAGLGYIIGDAKEAGGAGAVLGLLLGPLGAIIAGFLDFRTQCSRCGTRVASIAKVCPGCGGVRVYREGKPDWTQSV